MISRVRGTEDVLDLKLHNFAIDQLKKHLQIYNFNEILTPILEQTALFTHSLGTDTDVVKKEMYVIPQKDGDSICLRPEATASTIRAYIENHVEQRPWKVYTYGPMFRHERPQKGRWRQFIQFNIEAVNSESILNDAQFIKMLDSFFSEILCIENYVIKMNFLGCLQDRKEHKEALLKFLEKEKSNICETCLERKDKNTLRIFDCKNEACQKVYAHAPKLIDYLCSDCKKEWVLLQETLAMLSVSYVIDHTLVRGLDYYNKTVFEFTSCDLGAQTAFCGGGRYALGTQIGAKEDLPSIGAGIGWGRLLLLIEKNLHKLILPQVPALNVIIPMSAKQRQLSLLLANQLQLNGLCVEVILDNSSIGNMMKKANKLGAKFTLVLGEDEQNNGTVSIKNMQTGQSTVVKQIEAVKSLKA